MACGVKKLCNHIMYHTDSPAMLGKLHTKYSLRSPSIFFVKSRQEKIAPHYRRLAAVRLERSHCGPCATSNTRTHSIREIRVFSLVQGRMRDKPLVTNSPPGGVLAKPETRAEKMLPGMKRAAQSGLKKHHETPHQAHTTQTE